MAHQNQGERKMLHSVAFQGTPYFRWRLTRVGARGRACPGLISVGPFWAKTIPPTLARVIVECVRYVDHGSTIGGGIPDVRSVSLPRMGQRKQAQGKLVLERRPGTGSSKNGITL